MMVFLKFPTFGGAIYLRRDAIVSVHTGVRAGCVGSWLGLIGTNEPVFVAKKPEEVLAAISPNMVHDAVDGKEWAPA